MGRDAPGRALGMAAQSPLLDWAAEGVIPAEHYARLTGHPLYAEAARSFATNVLAAAAADKALDGIAKDAGRYVAASWMIYLHVSGGITLARLKDICVRSGLLSRGRARAVLLYLRYLGLIAPLPAATVAQYAPTPRLLTVWRSLLHSLMEAVMLIEPALGPLTRRLDDNEVLQTVQRIQGEGLFVAATTVVLESPFIRVFLHRHAGMQIVHWLVQAADTDDSFPPSRPIAVSISALARRFSVSRVHIKRLFAEAEREGLIRLHDDGAVQFTKEGREAVGFFYSSMMIGILSVAARTIAETPQALEAGAEKARREVPFMALDPAPQALPISE